MTFCNFKYLTDNDKANVANSSKIGKTDIMNHTAWKDRHANAVDKLLKFLESHYDLNGSGGTYSITHIKTWSNSSFGYLKRYFRYPRENCCKKYHSSACSKT